jgi:hypothetical protein
VKCPHEKEPAASTPSRPSNCMDQLDNYKVAQSSSKSIRLAGGGDAVSPHAATSLDLVCQLLAHRGRRRLTAQSF